MTLSIRRSCSGWARGCRTGHQGCFDLVDAYKTYHISILIVSLSSFNSATTNHKLFHDGGTYEIENGSLICGANQWTGFYMMGTSAMKVLIFKCIGKAPSLT